MVSAVKSWMGHGSILTEASSHLVGDGAPEVHHLLLPHVDAQLAAGLPALMEVLGELLPHGLVAWGESGVRPGESLMLDREGTWNGLGVTVAPGATVPSTITLWPWPILEGWIRFSEISSQ